MEQDCTASADHHGRYGKVFGCYAMKPGEPAGHRSEISDNEQGSENSPGDKNPSLPLFEASVVGNKRDPLIPIAAHPNETRLFNIHVSYSGEGECGAEFTQPKLTFGALRSVGSSILKSSAGRKPNIPAKITFGKTSRLVL